MPNTIDKRGDLPEEGHVIHVAFGPGGGRLSKQPKPSSSRSTRSSEPPPSSAPEDPVTDVFTRREVARFLQVSESRLRWLDQSEIVSPSGTKSGRRAYTFLDLIALRATRELLAHEIRPRDVARAIGALRSTLPRVTRPLHELRIVSDGRRVVVRSNEGVFEPTTGQLVLDFNTRQIHDDVVRVLRPSISPDRRQTAYDLYLEASQYDESPSTYEHAVGLYERAVALDPTLAIVYTNLGNIRFRQGDLEAAEILYHKALQYDVAQPEAHYNLGYMTFERGGFETAITYFLTALERDPRFADAHFNVAMAYERVTNRVKAREHWEMYLELEPAGAWADVARDHLRSPD